MRFDKSYEQVCMSENAIYNILSNNNLAANKELGRHKQSVTAVFHKTSRNTKQNPPDKMVEEQGRSSRRTANVFFVDVAFCRSQIYDSHL